MNHYAGQDGRWGACLSINCEGSVLESSSALFPLWMFVCFILPERRERCKLADCVFSTVEVSWGLLLFCILSSRFC